MSETNHTESTLSYQLTAHLHECEAIGQAHKAPAQLQQLLHILPTTHDFVNLLARRLHLLGGRRTRVSAW